jgi:hypothetical protein
MAVHWWRTDALVRELAEGRVGEHESLVYAMLTALLYFQAVYYGMWFGGTQSGMVIAEFAAVTLIAFAGLYECFKANGGAAGAEYLKRLYCLGVPVGIKVTLATVILGQAIAFSFGRLVGPQDFRDPYLVYQLLSLFFAGTFTIVFYWRVAHHMARVARAAQAK